jgi:HlyD family secretion protein
MPEETGKPCLALVSRNVKRQIKIASNKIMKQMKNKLKRRLYLFVGSFLAIMVLAISCGKKEAPMHPEYKPLVEAVYASGNIVPKDEYKVYSEVDGYLKSRLVNEGDSVHKGQPLFSIESDQSAIRMNNARTIYETAASNFKDNSPVLMEMRSNLNTAKSKLHNDSLNYMRYKNLQEHNATSQSEFDRISLAYHTSQNEYPALKERYAKTRTQLKTDYENAKAQYDLSQKDVSNYTITSNVNGRVYDVYKKEGELIRRQEAVAVLGESGHVYLKLTVDELDIDKIKTGQEIVVTVDVYKGKVFHAVVSKIYPMLNAQDQSFRVDAEFKGESPRRFSGLTVEANIIINSREKALTIPKAYLVGADSVMIKEDGKSKLVKIQKGAETYETVEVLSGLDVNSTIIKKQ